MNTSLKISQEKLANHMKEVFESLHERELKLSPSSMRIISPGKFEGEKFSVPFLYDCAMDHWDHIEEVTKNDTSPIYWVKLEHEDYVNLKISKEFKYAGIHESEQGFISCIYK